MSEMSNFALKRAKFRQCRISEYTFLSWLMSRTERDGWSFWASGSNICCEDQNIRFTAFMNDEFILRLRTAFDNASMAVVARRLGIPHATVRNYYQGRLPAPEVLIKIATETGVSLNWLLIGTGDMYAGQTPPVGLGKFIEAKIAEMIDQRLTAFGRVDVADLGATDEFNVESALAATDDPQRVMSDWFAFEGREYPKDFGVVFFRGWESFSSEDKVAAIMDAKRVLDRSLTD